MSHRSSEELKQDLLEAQKQVRIHGQYRHYKGQQYLVVGLVVIESTDKAGVLYRAEYTGFEDIVFLRPLEEFLSSVETNEGVAARFALVS